MKKFLLSILCVAFCLIKAQAQNDTVITFSPDVYHVDICFNRYQEIVLYAPDGCENFHWEIEVNESGLYESTDNPLYLNGNEGNDFYISHIGCGHVWGCRFDFINPNVPTETTEELWIHGGELAELQAVEADSASMYDIEWDTGETENIIYKPAGTYIAGISDMCATAYRTKVVKENVEIDLATCDLESNLNLVTWQTNPAQAQYIDHVIVKRDGLQVGTADYSDGQFTDNIGSGSASRTYTLTAVATDGTECPIVSYPKETIHMSYTLGMNNTIEIEWNTPTGYDLLGYNICEWNATDGTLTTIDYVGASVSSYTCQQSQFDQGYIVIQGVEAGKDGEMRLLSNRSSETVGIEENGPSTGSGALTVYPNPAKGAFTVEGTGRMMMTNVLGQTVLVREIDGKESIELPRGIYFVKLNASTRKVIVE